RPLLVRKIPSSHIKIITMRDEERSRLSKQGLAGRTPGTYQLKHGLTLATLGTAVAAQHRHEEAVGLWTRSLNFMGGVISDRNRQAVKTIKSAAAGYRKRGVTGAAVLDQRATELLKGNA
ncbi:tetratricopeptide repeat protein, partial [Streptomyces sp. NPDC090077]